MRATVRPSAIQPTPIYQLLVHLKYTIRKKLTRRKYCYKNNHMLQCYAPHIQRVAEYNILIFIQQRWPLYNNGHYKHGRYVHLTIY